MPTLTAAGFLRTRPFRAMALAFAMAFFQVARCAARCCSGVSSSGTVLACLHCEPFVEGGLVAALLEDCFDGDAFACREVVG